MPLISWNEFRFGESSPTTRAKRDVANGLKPLAAMASPFSHSTDNPAIEDKLIKMLKDDKKKSKKKKDEAVRTPQYDFDRFIKKAQKTQQEIDADKERAEEEEEKIDKEKEELEVKKKTTLKKVIAKPVNTPKPEQDNKKDEEEDDKNEWAFLCGDLI